MKQGEVEVKLKSILAKQLHVDANSINLNSKLSEDLGADSLDTTELAMSIEEELNYRLTDDEVRKLKTVSDLLECITRSLSNNT